MVVSVDSGVIVSLHLQAYMIILGLSLVILD